MMRRTLWIALFTLFAGPCFGQATVRPCFDVPGAPCQTISATNPLPVSATLSPTTLIPIAPATATATQGQLVGSQYNSTQATFTNGQQGAFQISSRGELKTNIMDAAGNARGVTVDASNRLAIAVADGADVALGAVGDTAWSSGNGTVISVLKNIAGGVSGAVPAGTNLIGKVGIDQTTPGSTNGVSPSITNAVWGTTSAMTGTTSTQLIAGTSSKVTYVTSISCVNSHATVGTFVTVQDGSGGTTLGTLAAAAVFGGTVLQSGGVPLFPPTTAGNGIFVADVTTGANVICTAAGFHS